MGKESVLRVPGGSLARQSLEADAVTDDQGGSVEANQLLLFQIAQQPGHGLPGLANALGHFFMGHGGMNAILKGGQGEGQRLRQQQPGELAG